jgi:hypothetical protein
MTDHRQKPKLPRSVGILAFVLTVVSFVLTLLYGRGGNGGGLID